MEEHATIDLATVAPSLACLSLEPPLAGVYCWRFCRFPIDFHSQLIHHRITPLIASLIARKKVNTRCNIVESARVDGKPRIVHQTYLGTAARVAALTKNATAPATAHALLARVNS